MIEFGLWKETQEITDGYWKMEYGKSTAWVVAEHHLA